MTTAKLLCENHTASCGFLYCHIMLFAQSALLPVDLSTAIVRASCRLHGLL